MPLFDPFEITSFKEILGPTKFETLAIHSYEEPKDEPKLKGLQLDQIRMDIASKADLTKWLTAKPPTSQKRSKINWYAEFINFISTQLQIPSKYVQPWLYTNATPGWSLGMSLQRYLSNKEPIHYLTPFIVKAHSSKNIELPVLVRLRIAWQKYVKALETST